MKNHIGNLKITSGNFPEESSRLNLDLESHLPCNGVFQTVQRSICQFLEWEIDEQKCFKIENYKQVCLKRTINVHAANLILSFL